MDLHDYLVDGVVHATTPRNETEAAARDRRAAIIAMLWAFHAVDAMEAMIACHCITLHFLANAAMHDAGDITLEPAVLIRARAGAMAISRDYRQWVSKFEALRKRNEARAAEAREAAKATAVVPEAEPVAVKSAAQTAPATPDPRPHPASPRPPAAMPVIQAVPNGPAAKQPAVPGNSPVPEPNGSSPKPPGPASMVQLGNRG